MKSRILLLLVSLTSVTILYGQCPNNNAFNGFPQTLSPTLGNTVSSTSTFGGDYHFIDVVLNGTYRITTCNGVNADTYLTLYDMPGTNVITFNDDFCGTLSEITWVSTLTGQVRLLLDITSSCFHDGAHHQVDVTYVSQLPVELTYFIGQFVDKVGIELNWETASESNNDFFELQRSIDAVEFNTIGRIDGKGNTSDLSSYYYLDRSIDNLPGYYYRLKQQDFDGQFEYSSVIFVGLHQDQQDKGITIYPNPVSGNQFYLTTRKNGAKGRLIDVTGKEVVRFVLDGAHGKIDIPQNAIGPFIMVMDLGSEIVFEKVLTK